MDFWSKLISIKLASPFLFIVIFSVLVAISIVAVILKKHENKSIVKLADIGDIKDIARARMRINSTATTVYLIVISLLVSLLVSGPKSIVEVTEKQTTADYLRIVITVTDISGSMNIRSKGFALEEEERLSSFDVINRAQIRFLSEAQDVIVGVVFFSSGALTYRYPTTDTEELIESLQSLSLVSSNEFGKNQLAELSSGTIATYGLLEAERLIDLVGKDLQAYDSVIVLFTDLGLSRIDETKEIIHRLSGRGIRIFIVTNASEYTIRTYQNYFDTLSQKVEFFRAQSQQEVDAALNKVAELEKSPIVQEKTIRVEESLADELAIILVLLLGTFVIFSELYFRKARGRRR